MKISRIAVLSLALFAAFATAPAPALEPNDPAYSGLSFPVVYTGEFLRNTSGGRQRGTIYDGLLSVSMDGDMDRLANMRGFSFHIGVINTHGKSLSRKYVGDFNGVSNISARSNTRLYDVWIQQTMADGRLSLRLGQLLADTEFFNSENGSLFINNSFGSLPVISRNLSSPVYPVAAPGVRLRVELSEQLSLQAAIYDGNVGSTDTVNRHGTDWNLDHTQGYLLLAEGIYNTRIGAYGRGLPATYKLGVFYHSRHTDRWESEHLNRNERRSNGGAYFIADQELWRNPNASHEVFSGYYRIGVATSERNTVPFSADAGLTYTGLIPWRVEDQIGVGLSYTDLSRYRHGWERGWNNSSHEVVLEATYKIRVNPWCELQPDFQYIVNPGGNSDVESAIVGGMRFLLSF